jgi:hypothetical protein
VAEPRPPDKPGVAQAARQPFASAMILPGNAPPRTPALPSTRRKGEDAGAAAA